MENVSWVFCVFARLTELLGLRSLTCGCDAKLDVTGSNEQRATK